LVLAEERTSEADRVKIMEARKKTEQKLKKLSLAAGGSGVVGLAQGGKSDSVETNSVEEDPDGEGF